MRPTNRAPDDGDSAAIPVIFLRLVIFLAGRLRRPHRPMQITKTVGWLKNKSNSNLSELKSFEKIALKYRYI